MKLADQNNLIPAIIQNAISKEILMLGYMNQAALDKTIELKKVTFYSRSKKRLWTKGESSGNFLEFVSIKEDCDRDTLLIEAIPQGPTCHQGTTTCFGNEKGSFIPFLEHVIDQRLSGNDSTSYTQKLFNQGINKVAQKVGEEAVELVIEAKDNNKDLFLNEAADLLFHYILLLKAKGFSLKDVEEVLRTRHKKTD